MNRLSYWLAACLLAVPGQCQPNKSAPRASSPPPAAKNGAGDARVRKALQKIGWTFDLTDTDNFRVTLELNQNANDNKKRLHAVVIHSATDSLGPLELRQVWAIARKSQERLTLGRLEAILKKNEDYKLGAWQMYEEDGGNSVLNFVAKVDANASAKQLQEIISAVANSADEMEKELASGTDEY